jgi:2-polyprenyl-6-methoxyphenol hydroxylase-like FAD-dependent oxidoreductase
MSETSSATLPLLIAGGGPTGLSLAITCGRFGVPVRIIDRAEQPSAVSKALAVWSGSLEAFDGMGVMPQFLAAGVRLHGLSAGTRGRELVSLKVGPGIDSPYPFPLLLPQSRTEQILGGRLAELGTTVERGVELADFTQDADGVTATLRHMDGREERVRTQYLVGCDGARSTVRQKLGVEFQGFTEKQICLLVDARIEGRALDPASIYLWWQNGGTIALFPVESGVWRVFAARDGQGDHPATLEELQAAMDRHGPGGMRLADPSWLSIFRTNERLAARYRVGRCFLAGDAAHIHSPAGGQGMNTGIQDAVNLGWKLGQVLNGVGQTELLLDSYEAERRPIAREVVKGAAQKFHMAYGAGLGPKLLKNMVVPLVMRFPAAQRRLQIELSETEIVYREGALIGLGAPPAKPRRTEVGARARDALIRDPGRASPRQLWPVLGEPRHTLLLFGTHTLPVQVAAAEGKWLRIEHLEVTDRGQENAAARYGMSRPGWVMVRPDQVVAARGDSASLDRVAAYVGQVISPALQRTGSGPASKVHDRQHAA